MFFKYTSCRSINPVGGYCDTLPSGQSVNLRCTLPALTTLWECARRCAWYNILDGVLSGFGLVFLLLFLRQFAVLQYRFQPHWLPKSAFIHRIFTFMHNYSCFLGYFYASMYNHAAFLGVLENFLVGINSFFIVGASAFKLPHTHNIPPHTPSAWGSLFFVQRSRSGGGQIFFFLFSFSLMCRSGEGRGTIPINTIIGIVVPLHQSAGTVAITGIEDSVRPLLPPVLPR